VRTQGRNWRRGGPAAGIEVAVVVVVVQEPVIAVLDRIMPRCCPGLAAPGHGKGRETEATFGEGRDRWRLGR